MAFFRRKSSRLNKDAELLLSAAEKVENYRGDLFSDEEKTSIRSIFCRHRQNHKKQQGVLLMFFAF